MEKKMMIGIFGTGAAVMVLELLGTRIVAPYIGASMYVWTSLIGVILGCMAIGYYAGGEIAKKRASMDLLGFVVCMSSVWVLFLALSKDVVLQMVMILFASGYLQSVVAAVVLFGVPAILLGLVSPMAAQILIKRADMSGEWVGRLYAISTMGSIVGTFLTGFWLIPRFGHLRILYMVAFVLAAIGWWWSENKKIWHVVLVVIALLGVFRLWTYKPMSSGVIVDRDTEYSRVKVVYESDGGRSMWINGARSSKAYIGEPLKLGFDYYAFYDLMFWHKRDLKEVLMIGGAGMGYPRYLALKNPDVKITVVEIDPQLYEIAKQYMGYEEDKNIEVVFEDGRVFLNNNKKKYDAILLDVFSGYTVPHHMVSVETIMEMKRSLSDDGVLVMNTIGTARGIKGELARSIKTSFENVFGDVRVFGVSTGNIDQLQNIALVASNKRLDGENSLNTFERALLKNELRMNGGMVFTDDLSPTDFYSVISVMN